MATDSNKLAAATTHGLLKESVVVQGKQAFSQWLDLIRWVAALAVVLAHSANRFFVHITSLDKHHRSAALYGFAIVSGFAHEAVMIFFVLSGYLVGGGLWKQAKTGSHVDLPVYFLKRLTRLCIVVYPTLLLTLLLNLLGIFELHGLTNGIYSSKALNSLQFNAFVCNAGFLQTGLCQPYGDNGALWSLYNEFWYYVTWPLFLLGVLSHCWWKRAVFLVTGTAILAVLTHLQFHGVSAIGPYMLIWALGILVAGAQKPLFLSAVTSVSVFLVGLTADRLAIRREFADVHPLAGFLVDLGISILFANMLLTLRFDQTLRPPRGGRWHTWFASFSFSLYCIHIPILNVYGAALKSVTGTGWQMLPLRAADWLVPAGAIILSLGSAYGLSRLTEANTERLRDSLLRQLARLRTSYASELPYSGAAGNARPRGIIRRSR